MSMEVNAYNNYATETANNSQDVSKKENTTSRSTQYKDVNEYARALQKQYSYFNARGSASGVPTTINVPLSLLQDCIKDPEKAANLEKSLKQIPDLVNYSKSIAGSCGCKITNKVYMVDADGNLSGVITTCTTGSSDSSASGNIEQNAKEERLARRKAAEKEQEERLAKQRAERKSEKEATIEAIRETAQSQEFTFFAKDAINFREKLTAIMQNPFDTTVSVSGMVGFDMKA